MVEQNLFVGRFDRLIVVCFYIAYMNCRTDVRQFFCEETRAAKGQPKENGNYLAPGEVYGYNKGVICEFRRESCAEEREKSGD